MDYAPFLLDKIVRPLKELGTEGVVKALDVLKEYRLLREDIDALVELTTWPGMKSPMDSVDSKVKAALTRAYNKDATAYTYSATAAIKKKNADKADTEDSETLGYGEDADGNDENAKKTPDSDAEDDIDNLDNDALIKAKKKPVAKGSAATAAAKKSSTAGGSGRSKGKGK